MESHQINQVKNGEHDEDVQFERDKESAIIPLTESVNDQPENTPGESTLPTKEDTLGNSDFPPLTELEKQPKLDDKERIDEMNRRTSLGD
jgi:hypothetical protein